MARMKLPNGDRAELGGKLEDYSLTPAHLRGHKARVFESALGITLENKETLTRALRNAATNSEEFTFTGDNGFGDTYVLRFRLATEKGAAFILSAWIVRHGEGFLRLATCFIV